MLWPFPRGRRLDRRELIKGLGVGAAAFSLSKGRLLMAGEQTENKPNIILITADDLGTECLGCYGGTSYKTPHIDALAKESVRFTNAYSTPLCTPSRVQLLTGQYPFRTGWNKGIWLLPEEEQCLDPGLPSMARVLKSQGYATAVAGKWQLARFDQHPDHPGDLGFDNHCVWSWSMEDECPSRYWSPGIWRDKKKMADTEGKFGPDICCDYLADFIRRNREGPFFAFYPMILPHKPFVLPPGDDADREGTQEPGWRAQRNFSAMVEYLDGQVGRLIKLLKELGLDKNTLVVFTSDNGSPMQIVSRLGEKEIKGGKFLMSEAGTRVPLIACWPGSVSKGTVCRDLIDFTDLFPSFAEAGGAAMPQDVHFDGRSFLPQIKGEHGNPRKWVYCEKGTEWFIRNRYFRLKSNGKFHYMGDRYAPQLVDLNNNPQARAVRTRMIGFAKELGKDIEGFGIDPETEPWLTKQDTEY